nr:putative metalloprotease Tcis_Metallo_1 [Tityus cisandinus]
MDWRVRNHALLMRLVCFIIFVRIYDTARSEDVRSEFRKHYVIHPKLHTLDGREKRDVSNIKGEHEDNLVMTFDNLGHQIILDLKMNSGLLPDNYFEKYHLNSSIVMKKPMLKSRRHCHYQGQVRGSFNSWAAISTCQGISGMIFDGNETYYVHPVNDNSHLLLKASDWKSKNLTCGYKTSYDEKLRSHVLAGLNRHRRSAVLQPPPGSNSNSRYVELILVNDFKEYKELKEDVNSVFERSKEIANILNGLYTPLNIFIALVGVITWTEKDPISMSPDGDATLTNFLHYRRERLAREHPNDNAQLITAMTFDGGVVGKALKGPICTYEYSGGVNMDHSHVVGLVATTVAHELGHNFGMEHDSDECICPDEKCIMASASSATSPHHWSSCSREYIRTAFSKGMDYCLKNIPSTIVGPICGNGFLEEGEDCDCGLPEFCNNPCCNATSCRLTPNANCATGSCCDIQTCQVKPVATICRSASSECDLPEYCDGLSEYCPTNNRVQDGTECSDGNGYCYDSLCQSHNNQCRLLWGVTGKSSHPQCYEQNSNGNLNGNCGFDRINKKYKACSKRDVRCGMLQCIHLNEKLEFGMHSTAIVSRSFINVQGKILACRTALIDLGLNSMDPGLSPNGAKCGEEMACLNQKCVHISEIRKKRCPQNCNGHGTCNSNYNCHCEFGYAPPFCDSPGLGGSIDSGPPSDPNAGQSFFIAMLIIFLGIIPFVAVVAYIIYHYHHHLKNWWFVKFQKPTGNETTNKPPPKKFNYPHGTITKLEISAPFLQHGPNDPIVTVPLETAQKQMQNGHLANNVTISQDAPVCIAPTRPAPKPPATVQRSQSVAGTSSTRRMSRPLSDASYGKRNLPPPPRPPPPKHVKAGIRPQSFSAGSSNTQKLSNVNTQELPPKVKSTSTQSQPKKKFIK